MNPSLEMQVKTAVVSYATNGGLYIVTYGRKEAPLDVQEAVFAANGLNPVSPAQLGFLRANADNGTFDSYSRTNVDVFYDDRHNQVVIVPGGAISKLVGIADLVTAHSRGEEYVIPENQRDLVYAMVGEMLINGAAFTANHGKTVVRTSEFGKNKLTSKLFSDEILGIEAQGYGNWLQFQGIKTLSIFFDPKDYAELQKGPYLNRLRVCGPDYFFVVGGDYWGPVKVDGAFGVRFNKLPKAARKNRKH